MSSLRELVHGDGRLDTALRSLSLAVFVAVAAAIIWTALAVHRQAAALPFETAPGYDIPHLIQDSIQSTNHKETNR